MEMGRGLREVGRIMALSQDIPYSPCFYDTVSYRCRTGALRIVAFPPVVRLAPFL